MTAYRFAVLDVAAEPYAVAPQLTARLRIEETTNRHIHAIALRCQVRIEPQRRRYDEDEENGLRSLFGERSRWGDTLKPFLWMQANTTVQGFTGSTETDLALPCTYDLDVVGTRYLHALDAGDVPLDFLFSGTIFTRGGSGFDCRGGRARRLGRDDRLGRVGPRRWRRRAAADGRHQAIAALADGLDVLRLGGIVSERAPQRRDAPRHRVVGDVWGRPHRRHQLVAGDDPARRRGEAQQHLHDARLHGDLDAVAVPEPVQGRRDGPLAHLELHEVGGGDARRRGGRGSARFVHGSFAADRRILGKPSPYPPPRRAASGP